MYVILCTSYRCACTIKLDYSCINCSQKTCFLGADVNDLHRFVSVALHTSAGEGDLSSDKLSNLKTIGSGFGPLIYGLQKTPSFSYFQEACEAVWKAVKQTPNLTTLLVSPHTMAL